MGVFVAGEENGRVLEEVAGKKNIEGEGGRREVSFRGTSDDRVCRDERGGRTYPLIMFASV